MINQKRKTASNAAKYVVMIALILLSCFIINPTSARTTKCKITIADSTMLNAFEGIYQNKVNTFAYFKITAVNNTLVAKQVDGNQQFVLTRKSEFVFETKDDDGDEDIPVTFAKNEAGEITQVLVGGKDLWIKVKEIVPVKEVRLSPAQLKSVEGKYEFEQKKGAFIQITATTDGLTLKQSWDGREINFIALTDVDFLNKEVQFPLKFIKDPDGNAIKVLAFNRDMWDKVKE